MSNPKLFEKVILNNNIEVPNRLGISSLTLFTSNPDGTMTDQERVYLKLRGTDIVLYVLGVKIISKEGMTTFNFPLALSENDIPALQERAKIIQSQGAKAIIQINHSGCFVLKKNTGLSPIVPSADIAIKDAERRGSNEKDFHEFTDEKIKSLIDKFTFATELS